MRIIVGVVVAAVVTAGLTAIDQTPYASWSHGATYVLMAAAVVGILRRRNRVSGD